MRKIMTLITGLAVAVLGGLTLGPLASAADVTLVPGDSIQAAISAVTNGDTITLSAGTYNVTAAVTIENGKSVNIVGDGAVTINLTSATPGRALKIYNTSNVTVSNISLTTTAAGNNPPTWGGDMGVDISNACNVTLSGVSISGFGKFGIEVTAAQTGTETDCATTNGVTLNNVSVSNSTGGIAFYDTSSAGVTQPLTNIALTGTTTISNTNYGVDLNDASGAAAITSPGALDLDLGTVAMTSVTAPIITNAVDKVTLHNDSIVNGTAISSLSEGDLETLLGLPAGTIAISGRDTTPTTPTNPTPGPVVPNTPNTGASQDAVALMTLSVLAVLAAVAVGAINLSRYAKNRG